MALYSRLSDTTVPSPILVMCLEGWIDAGLGAAAALSTAAHTAYHFGAIRQIVAALNT